MNKRLLSYFINKSFYNPQKLFIYINDDVNDESDGEEEDLNDFEPINKPGIEDTSEALQVLQDFSLFSKSGQSMLKSLKELPHTFKTFPTSLLNTNPLYSKIMKNPDQPIPSFENVLNLSSAKLLKYIYHSSSPSSTSL